MFASLVAQRIDEQGESPRRLPAIRIVEVIAGERIAPIGEDPRQSAIFNVGLCLILKTIASPAPAKRPS